MVKKKHSPFLGGAGGGFQVSWTKYIQMFFVVVFFNFPKGGQRGLALLSRPRHSRCVTGAILYGTGCYERIHEIV